MRLRGQRRRFYDDPDRMNGFNSHPVHVVAFLDRTLHDDSL